MLHAKIKSIHPHIIRILCHQIAGADLHTDGVALISR